MTAAPQSPAAGLDLTHTTESRIAAALKLEVRPLGRDRYGVGENDWTVDLSDADHPRCGCKDHMRGGFTCKHIIAALYHRAPEDDRAAVRAKMGA